MKKKILIIIGSVRPVRAGGKVARWVMNRLGNRKNGFDYELVDLREIDLPFFDEPVSPRAAESYVHQHTRDWSAIVEPAAGFVFVTPEYNHGYSPALKNALDYLYREWKGKPAGFVGYGSNGAQDSIRQIKEVLSRFNMNILDNQIGVSKIWEAFDDEEKLREELVTGDLSAFADEIEEKASMIAGS